MSSSKRKSNAVHNDLKRVPQRVPGDICQPAHVTLRPARLSDRRQIYQWLAQSDATPEMMGPPTFDDHPVPSFAEFVEDFDDTAFADSGPFRLYVIALLDEEVGATCYFVDGEAAELDIWIGSKRHWGRGIGRRALALMIERLIAQTSVRVAVIRPSMRNRRAVHAYQRAGFQIHDPALHDVPAWCLEDRFDYHDAVVLVRPLNQPVR